MDWLLADIGKGERLFAGITVNYGEVSSRIRSILGNGALKTEGYGIGATLTWYGAAGLYFDAQAQFNRYTSNLSSDLLSTLTDDKAAAWPSASRPASESRSAASSASHRRSRWCIPTCASIVS